MSNKMLEKFIFFLFLSTIITIDKSNQQYGIIPECKLDGLEQTILWSTAADFSRIQSPKMINIWPGERINLTHHIMHKSNLSKIWLWQTGENFKTGYRLQETVECFTMKREIQYNPYREIYNLLIHKDGIYALAFKEVDWQANIEKGLHETYIPLAIYTVSVLKPASIGYTLRLIAYHSDDQCYDIQHKTEWIFQALSKNKLESKENTKLLNSKFEYKTLETRCSQLPNDDSPIQMIYYYNINRLKVTPNGYTPASERPWKLITSYKSYVIKESLLINLPREFGMAKRIRLENIQVPFGDGLKITLKSISDEGVSEGLWGLGHVTPPFSDDRILHQIYAVVKLNSSLYDLLREKPDELNIQWILIEPIYGRLRTSSGITVQMNQYYHWTNAQYLTQLEINHLKSINQYYDMTIDKINFEVPSHAEDINEIRKAIYNKRPLPSGEIRPSGRACFTMVNNFGTSFLHVTLNNPKACIKTDSDKYAVKKHIESPRSPLIAYSVKLLTDEYGDEWRNIHGYIFIHIHMRSYSRKSRKQNSQQGCEYYTSGEYGEIMRLGFLEIGQIDIRQYLTRWEDRWFEFYNGRGEKYVFVEEFDQSQLTHGSQLCPPHSTTLLIKYHIDTKLLLAWANDTQQILLNVTLESHPAWMALEMFTDPESEDCPGCFVSAYIDRRTVHRDTYNQWLEREEGINDWNQIQYPKPTWANYISRHIVKLSQSFEEKNKPIASAQNMKKRTINIIRQLANPLDVSVAVLRASTYCALGQYQIYHTPAVCAYCPPGTFSVDLTPNESHPTYGCQICPKGTYQQLPGQGECLKCKGVASTKQEGAWYADLCIRQAKDADDSDVLRKEIHRKGEPSMRINIQPGDEGDILSSTSLSLLSKSTHDWVNDPSEIKTYNMDVPAELSIISTQRLVFNIICFLLLLGCIMIFVVISKGYMLVRLTNRTRMHLITRRKMSLAARTSAFSIRKSGLWSLAQKTKTESIRESDDEESTKSD